MGNKKRALAAGAVAVIVAGGGSAAWAMTGTSHQPDGYSSARAMAAKAGCAASFRPLTAYAGTTTAGACRIDGTRVVFVTTSGEDSAAAWVDGARAAAVHRLFAGVGTNWAFVTSSASAFPSL